MQSPCIDCNRINCLNLECDQFVDWYKSTWDAACKRLADACGVDLQQLRHNFRVDCEMGRRKETTYEIDIAISRK